MAEARLLNVAGVVGVCGWLADGYQSIKTLGGKPGSIAVLRDVIDVGYPPLGGCMSQFVAAVWQVRRLCGGPSSGKLSGGNWMALSIGNLWVTVAQSRALRRPN